MFSGSIPVVMVRTFQLPSLRVGLFLRLCLSGDIVSVYFSLKAIPIHPMRKVNCGGTTPYWLRAAQLKAGGGCSVELKNSSYRRIRPLAPILSPNRIRLITGNCRIPCCVFAKNLRSWSKPLQAQSQGITLRFQLLPMQQDLTLHSEKSSAKQQSWYSQDSSLSQELPEWHWIQSQTAYVAPTTAFWSEFCIS